MIKLMATIDNHRGFINLVFGIMLAIIGYFVVSKLQGIEDTLKETQNLLQEFNTSQSVTNASVELRLKILEGKQLNGK